MFIVVFFNAYQLEEDNSIAPSLLDDDGMFQDGDVCSNQFAYEGLLTHSMLCCSMFVPDTLQS